MGRNRLTQVFSCLLPLRKRQKKLFFYAKMRLDGNHYAEERSEQELPYLLFQTSCRYIVQRSAMTGFIKKTRHSIWN